MLRRLWDAGDALAEAVRAPGLEVDLRVRLDGLRAELADLARDLHDRVPDAAATAAWSAWTLGLLRPEVRAELETVRRSGTVRPGVGGGRSSARWKAKRGKTED